MKLSIITVNYNNCPGLQRTIDSVVAQTWRDFEWIIIDGGSTDGSRELIEKYQVHFSYWCSEPDKGIYNAMNKGIAKAKGEYLNFMNSGDCFYEKDTLEKVNDRNPKADIVYCDFSLHENLFFYKISNMMLQLFESSIDHQSTFIRRILFEKYKYDERLTIAADWKFFLQTIIIDNVSVEHLDIVVCYHDSFGISTSSLNVDERLKILDDMFPRRFTESLDLLHHYSQSRPIQRARLLVCHGGFAEKLTRAILKTLDKIFLRIKFGRDNHIIGN